MQSLTELAGLCRAGVYCLHDSEYAYFGYSKDILGAVADILREIKDGTFKIMNMKGKDLNLHVFEDLAGGDDIETLKLRTQAKALEYENNGWVLWNPAIKSLLKYEVVTLVSLDPKCVYVLLKTASRSVKTVGAFDSMDEAEQFISEFYSPFVLPVYACNSRTREELCKRIRGTI